MIGEGERVLGVSVRCLSPAELSAVNLLLSELNLPPVEQDQRVEVASRRGWDSILFNCIQTCESEK